MKGLKRILAVLLSVLFVSVMMCSCTDENGKDTNIDPFMASYPELLDIGIMQTCVC